MHSLVLLVVLFVVIRSALVPASPYSRAERWHDLQLVFGMLVWFVMIGTLIGLIQ